MLSVLITACTKYYFPNHKLHKEVLRGQPLMQVVFHEPDGASHSSYSDICSVIG